MYRLYYIYMCIIYIYYICMYAQCIYIWCVLNCIKMVHFGSIFIVSNPRFRCFDPRFSFAPCMAYTLSPIQMHRLGQEGVSWVQPYHDETITETGEDWTNKPEEMTSMLPTKHQTSHRNEVTKTLRPLTSWQFLHLGLSIMSTLKVLTSSNQSAISRKTRPSSCEICHVVFKHIRWHLVIDANLSQLAEPRYCPSKDFWRSRYVLLCRRCFGWGRIC